MPISEGELLELQQHTPVLCKDNRTGGLAKMWITDGIHLRWVRDDAEAVLMQDLFHLHTTYPTGPLPVVSYTILQRIPLVGASPP